VNIYVLKDGLRYGPYTIDELKEQLDLGAFKPENFASIDDCRNWLRIQQLPEMRPPSFCVEIDESHNLLVIRYRGSVDQRDIERCPAAVRHALSKLSRGFQLLADFTQLRQMDASCAPAVAEIMDLCNEASVATVVRVIPQPRQDIGLQIMSLFHYRSDVEIATCTSIDEAMKILGRHEHGPIENAESAAAAH
jgi:hypothetical protein